MNYIDFFDIHVPTLKVCMIADNLNYEIEINFFSSFNSHQPLEFIPDENNTLNTSTAESPYNTQSNSSNLTNIKASSDSTSEIIFGDLALAGLFAAMSIIGAVMSLHGAYMNGLSGPWELFAFGVTIVAFITSIVLLILTFIETTDHPASFIWGLSWGFLAAFFEITFIFGLGEAKNIPKVVSIFSTLVAIVNIIANFSLIAGYDLMQNTAILIDIMAVGLGCFSILSVNNPEAKKRAMLTYTCLLYTSPSPRYRS